MSPLNPEEVEEVLGHARSVLSRDDFEKLEDEIHAADQLPDEAAHTQLSVALSRYPATREMVRQFASGERWTLRGAWLDETDWQRLNRDADDER